MVGFSEVVVAVSLRTTELPLTKLFVLGHRDHSCC